MPNGHPPDAQLSTGVRATSDPRARSRGGGRGTGGSGATLRPGEIVLAHHKLACGSCRPCSRGTETLCTNARVLGIDRDGGYAEHTTTEASRVISLPPSVTPAAGAALTCGGVAAHHALRTVARVVPSETVRVLGTGGVGLFAVPTAKRLGAEVIAADLRVRALHFARPRREPTGPRASTQRWVVSVPTLPESTRSISCWITSAIQ